MRYKYHSLVDNKEGQFHYYGNDAILEVTDWDTMRRLSTSKEVKRTRFQYEEQEDALVRYYTERATGVVLGKLIKRIRPRQPTTAGTSKTVMTGSSSNAYVSVNPSGLITGMNMRPIRKDNL